MRLILQVAWSRIGSTSKCSHGANASIRISARGSETCALHSHLVSDVGHLPRINLSPRLLHLSWPLLNHALSFLDIATNCSWHQSRWELATIAVYDLLISFLTQTRTIIISVCTLCGWNAGGTFLTTHVIVAGRGLRACSSCSISGIGGLADLTRSPHYVLRLLCNTVHTAWIILLFGLIASILNSKVLLSCFKIANVFSVTTGQCRIFGSFVSCRCHNRTASISVNQTYPLTLTLSGLPLLSNFVLIFLLLILDQFLENVWFLNCLFLLLSQIRFLAFSVIRDSYLSHCFLDGVRSSEHWTVSLYCYLLTLDSLPIPRLLSLRWLQLRFGFHHWKLGGLNHVARGFTGLDCRSVWSPINFLCDLRCTFVQGFVQGLAWSYWFSVLIVLLIKLCDNSALNITKMIMLQSCELKKLLCPDVFQATMLSSCRYYRACD